MLNESQMKAEKEIKKWLLMEDEPIYVLKGPGGYGKSYLLDHLENNIHEYNKRRHIFSLPPLIFELTATTNKAAAVLQNAQTVHKLFGFRPVRDYKTGETKLVSVDRTQVVRNAFLIIDEASQLDADTLRLIIKYTDNCKILFVGDDCQLKPVNAKTSPVFDQGFPSSELTIPQRQDPNSPLFQLCEQLRRTVRTGKWEPLQEAEGIRFVDGAGASNVFNTWFPNMQSPQECRAITFTNTKAIQFNTHVRQLCGYSADFQEGDTVYVRNFVWDMNGRNTLGAMTLAHIDRISTETLENYGVEFYKCKLAGKGTFLLPVDPARAKQVIADAAVKKSWHALYWLQESALDLRSAYAETSHTSQGSSYDRVFINLTDLGKCRDPDTLARLLYVAVSRARKEVVFNGQLPTQYRG